MNRAFAVLILLLGIALIFGVVAENIPQPDILDRGKNYVEVEQPIYAREFIVENPQIEYISFYDENLGRQLAFVNVFGGIGQNFLLIPGEKYEISSKYEAQILLEENSVKIVE